MANQKPPLEPPESRMFYQRERMIGGVQGSSMWRVLRATGDVLAHSRSGIDGASAAVLLTDLNRSVLTALRDDQPEHVAYMPFGFGSFAHELPGLPGFNGEVRDSHAGHYLLGNYRVYSPALMRFHNPDSWSPFGDGGINPYAYVGNDPINATDPTGHMPLPRRKSSPDLLDSRLGGPLPSLEPHPSARRASLQASNSQPRLNSLNQSQSNSRRSSLLSSNLSLYGSLDSMGSQTSIASGSSGGLSSVAQRYGKNVMAYLKTVPRLEDHRSNWSVSKKQAYFTKSLTETEQFKFDVFQDAIHHYQVSAPFAAGLMGRSNHKQLGTSGIWQVRLSGGGRMTYVVNESVVMIRDVGGHT